MPQRHRRLPSCGRPFRAPLPRAPPSPGPPSPAWGGAAAARAVADSAASATAGSEPPSISARRTSSAFTPAARATASVITPSSAPWCISPVSSRPRNERSAGVARANRSASSRRRSACVPGPVTAPMTANTSSRPPRVSARPRPELASALSGPDAGTAGRIRSLRAAYPTPICRWRSSPDRKATARPISPGSARRSRPASSSILARRPGAPATASDVRTSSLSSTPAFCPTAATLQGCASNSQTCYLMPLDRPCYQAVTSSDRGAVAYVTAAAATR